MVRPSTPVTPQVLDASNPFFIGSNDHPGALIVSDRLLGPDNYHSWARSFSMALIFKNKLGFVNGRVVPPESSDLMYSAWERANVLVLGWIHRAISPEIAQSVLWLDSSRDVWLDLNARFGRTDLVRISELYDRISCFRQGELNVTAYYTRFKLFWDEYVALRPLPVCSCTPRCSCDISSKMQGFMLSEQMIQFLRGLNGAFGSVRSQILRTTLSPTINQAFSMVIQEERELGFSASVDLGLQTGGIPSAIGQSSQTNLGQSLAMASRSSYPSKGTVPRVPCSFCGIHGHTIDRCYAKNGYPPGYKAKGRGRGQRPAPAAHAVQGTLVTEEDSGYALTSAQFQALRTLFNNNTGDAVIGGAANFVGPSSGISSNDAAAGGGGQSLDAGRSSTTDSLDQAATSAGSFQFSDDWYS